MEYNKRKGVLLMLLTSFCFSTQSAIGHLLEDIPPMEKTLFRNAVAVILILLVIRKKKTPVRLTPGTLPLHLGRSLFGVLNITLNFYAMDHMVLSDATILMELSPFIIILLSAFLLREKAGLKIYGIVLMAFMGAALVAKPSGNILSQTGTLAALGAALFIGLAYFFVRFLNLKKEESSIIILFFSIFSCLFCLPSVLLHPVALTARHVGLLILMSLFAFCGQLTVTEAYHYAPASDISILDYTQVIFSALYGFLLFGQLSDRLSYLGYIIILSAAMLSFLHKKKQLAGDR